jgi:hypothetical protein
MARNDLISSQPGAASRQQHSPALAENISLRKANVMKTLIVALSLIPSLALAGTTSLELAPGIGNLINGGPNRLDQDSGQNAGPGNEQASVAPVKVGDATYLVSVYMSSNVVAGDNPWQCKCSSIELTAAGPVLRANQVQLTALNGNRPCNHPQIASDGTNLVWTYGSNHDNQATVRTYVAGINHLCQQTAAPLRISANANNNEGAPDIIALGNGKWLGSYLSTGTNDASYARLITLNGSTLSNGTLRRVVAPSNIGRPTTLRLADDRALFCSAQGDNRPPEDGVRCALLDGANNIIWNQLIARSIPNQGIYMNQPQVAPLSDGKVALMVIESSGEGRNKNDKGSSKTHLFALSPTDSGPGVLGSTSGADIGLNTHSGLCSGSLDNGAKLAGVWDASVTGSGLAQLKLAEFTGSGFAPKATRVGGPYNGDSAYLANRYGQNPNTQGREFLRCSGIDNPNFGVAGAWESASKELFVLPYAGKRSYPAEEAAYRDATGRNLRVKNALFLSFVAGTSGTVPDATTPPPANNNPAPAPSGDLNNPANTQIIDDVGSGIGKAKIATGGSGCSSVGNGGLVAAMLGLAAMTLLRRRQA